MKKKLIKNTLKLIEELEDLNKLIAQSKPNSKK